MDIDDSQKAEVSDPDKEKVEASGHVIKKGKPSKIFVTGSSDLLRDNLLDPEGRTPNSIFVLNLLDTLNSRDKTAVLRSKQQAYNPLADVSGIAKTTIKWFNIAGLPALVVFFGFIVLLLRMAKKRRIRMMFSR